MAVAGDLNGQFAEVALEGLPALAVAGVASGIGHRLVAFMAQVLSQLSVQGSLDQQLGQLLEQTVLADEVFGLLVVGQQARQQFFGYVVFLGAHCAYGQAGLRRRLIVRLHKILHTLGLAADLGPQCLFPTEVLKALVDELQAYLALVPGYAPRTAAFARATRTLDLLRQRITPAPGPASTPTVAIPSGEHFMTWLQQGVAARRLIINDAKALVHTVSDTAYLVSPGVFQRYAQEHPQVDALARQDKQQDWQWVQKRFEKLQLHRKHQNGLNIWTCEVTGPRKSRRLHRYLLENGSLVFAEIPPNNPYLALPQAG